MPSHRAVIEMIPTLKLIKVVAKGTIPTSMDFRQEFALDSYPVSESSKNSTAERGVRFRAGSRTSEKSASKSSRDKIAPCLGKGTGMCGGAGPS